jgi:hypothetical protein
MDIVAELFVRPATTPISSANLGLTTRTAKSTPEYAGDTPLIVPHIWWKTGMAFCYEIPLRGSLDQMD